MTEQRTTSCVLPAGHDVAVACDWIAWWGHANDLALWAYPLETLPDGSVDIAVAGPLRSLREFRDSRVSDAGYLILDD
jgi:hypothetical protein